MHELLQALVHAMNTYPGWTILFCFLILSSFFGALGKAIGGGGGKKAKGQLEAKEAEITRLHTLLQRAQTSLRSISAGVENADVAQLARDLGAANSELSIMQDLLRRVQTADQAYPQLGLGLHNEINALMAKHYEQPAQIETRKKRRPGQP